MDFILADCVVCGRETDAYDGDPHPRCMSCFDKGLSAKWKSSMDPERIERAKKMYAERKSVVHISQVLRASPTMVRVWLGLGVVNNQVGKNGSLHTGSSRNSNETPSNIVSFMEVSNADSPR